MEKDHVYVIAEAGVNHNGERDKAFALIDAAVAAGADAVKFQTFKAAQLATTAVPKAHYQTQTSAADESQLEMLEKLELPWEWHAELKAHAKESGIQFLSTAFDSGSLVFLNELGIPRFKVPSGEITNGPLLWQFARTGKPLIVSTGMATLSDVEQALAVIFHARNHEREPASMDEVWRAWGTKGALDTLRGHVSLLHCTSQYPTIPEEVNLRAMDTLAQAFHLEVGYSDHTAGIVVPLAAAARGARIIEKHFTLDRELPGPDHRASLEPDELKAMVRDIRLVQRLLGDARKAPQPSEWDTRSTIRKQIVAARPIKAGQPLVRADLSTARAGSGLEPNALWGMVGAIATRDFAPGEPIA